MQTTAQIIRRNRLSRTGRGLFLLSLNCVFFQLSGPRELSIYEGSPGSAGRVFDPADLRSSFYCGLVRVRAVPARTARCQGLRGAAAVARAADQAADGWCASLSEAASCRGRMVRAVVGGGVMPRASSPPVHPLPVHRDSDRCIDLQVPRFFRCPSPPR